MDELIGATLILVGNPKLYLKLWWQILENPRIQCIIYTMVCYMYMYINFERLKILEWMIDIWKVYTKGCGQRVRDSILSVKPSYNAMLWQFTWHLGMSYITYTHIALLLRCWQCLHKSVSWLPHKDGAATTERWTWSNTGLVNVTSATRTHNIKPWTRIRKHIKIEISVWRGSL